MDLVGVGEIRYKKNALNGRRVIPFSMERKQKSSIMESIFCKLKNYLFVIRCHK
jgi:hypothetical protein